VWRPQLNYFLGIKININNWLRIKLYAYSQLDFTNYTRDIKCSGVWYMV